ncbi:MAG: OB-fold domain-containing protein [Chloroflexota bacterium]|nr:OB-fold domain-containing protein [Chloroflexota bacterium]MQG36967.1 OB-fold domain-containing protein [SAR202 cluster bacterium]|tara:strand:+ start:677 stop:1102 length:426 start_codon:yes stop_codon:yes gene_type:complete
MENTTSKPQPISQPESDRYWAGLKNEEIWLQRSVTTGEFQFYPRNFPISDPENGIEGIEWVKVSGEAELFTFAIVYAAPHMGFAGDVPYITALVRLKEGVIIPTNIVGVEPQPQALSIGMLLKPVYEHSEGRQTLLKFTPA